MQDRQVVVRFPPSPTGEIHIGNVRTLLFNYLFAKKNNGQIVFRFEDTDKERSKKEYEQPMLDALHTLGLSWENEGREFRQSERVEIYRKYLHLLVENGLAYEDVENAQGTGKIIRLKNIEREIVWNDLVKGEIKINTHTFKERDEDGNFTGENAADIIIARSIDDPIYHFTVVVDDWLMGVTHVIRGDDHITSTPRQIMILEALQQLEEKLKEENLPNVIIPTYAHLPTIIGEDRKKLSKRNGTTSLKAFFELGYLKETMVNYLALLGWNPGDEREFFTLEELVKEFSFEKCQVSPAQFDFKKLDNINKHYLSKISDAEFIAGCLNTFTPEEVETINANLETNKKVFLKVLKERVAKYSEVPEAYRTGEVNMFFKYLYDQDFKSFDLSKICFKNQTLDEAKVNLKLVKEKIEEITDENWNVENLKNAVWDWSATIGRGQVLHPLRMVMSLKEKSPDPFTIMEIIGKEESLRRFDLFL
jgi:nondiscriminating glutamyl-tRNA synthetase